MSVRPSLHNIFDFFRDFCRGFVAELHVAVPGQIGSPHSWTRPPAHFAYLPRPSGTHSTLTMFILNWFWDILAQLGTQPLLSLDPVIPMADPRLNRSPTQECEDPFPRS
jgi:hypothetical protein